MSFYIAVDILKMIPERKIYFTERNTQSYLSHKFIVNLLRKKMPWHETQARVKNIVRGISPSALSKHFEFARSLVVNLCFDSTLQHLNRKWKDKDGQI